MYDNPERADSYPCSRYDIGGSWVAGGCSVHISLNRIPGTKTTQSWNLQLDTGHLSYE